MTTRMPVHGVDTGHGHDHEVVRLVVHLPAVSMSRFTCHHKVGRLVVLLPGGRGSRAFSISVCTSMLPAHFYTHVFYTQLKSCHQDQGAKTETLAPSCARYACAIAPKYDPSGVHGTGQQDRMLPKNARSEVCCTGKLKVASVMKSSRQPASQRPARSVGTCTRWDLAAGS